ncbi:hypothetical protein E8E14_007348 [Neopestalotiopsis sp. 37M]|nr:hypothetical protein E8E14_007348 [Neopestalotiopsis sp. 37M]
MHAHNNVLGEKPESPIFLTHPPILASEYRDKLIGACVANPYNPTNAYSSADRPWPKELIPRIDPKEVEIDNYRDVLDRSSTSHAKAVFEKIITLFFERDSNTTEAREAASAKWWSMETPQDHFERLMEQSSYRNSVLKLLKKNQGNPVYLVTNILVLSAPKVDKTRRTSRKDGASAAIPDPHTHGATNIVDVSVGAGRSTEGSIGGQFRHEMIVGLGVYEVNVPKPKATSWFRRIFKKEDPELTTLAVPINDGVLREVRMGRKLAKAPDGATFMGGKAEKEMDSEPQSDDQGLAFKLYFPQDSVDGSAP